MSSKGNHPLLDVRNLETHFDTREGVVRAVNGVSFSLDQGATLGIVGESGCGKTVTALSIMRLIRRASNPITKGEVWLAGRDLRQLKADEMRKVRGRDIAMIFQDPMTALNPVLRVGRQISEVLEINKGMDRATARKRAIELLDLVGIPSPNVRVDDYPYQFSGGMRQRVVIAIALSCEPRLMIADEPTTALDVTIEAQILELLQRLRRQLGMSLIIITHNLGIVAEITDRVCVMYAGYIVESGTTDDIFNRPAHPYTLGLLQSVPSIDFPLKGKMPYIKGNPPDTLQLPRGCPFSPRCRYVIDQCLYENPKLVSVDEEGHKAACWLSRDEIIAKDEEKEITIEDLLETEASAQVSYGNKRDEELIRVENLKVYFPITKGFFRRKIGEVKAVDDISFHIKHGETFALVGESGSGKSTTGLSILQLYKPKSGHIAFREHDLTRLPEKELRRLRGDLKIIFQDPFASLDPRMTVGNIIAEPLEIQSYGKKKDRQKRVQELLRVVGLDQRYINRYPHEFSGGQRQRIGIARALTLNPSFIVCDEPVSALDVSIQAQVINLLQQLKDQFGLTYLFIAHNLIVVRQIADRVAVMYSGKILEIAPNEILFKRPLHPYTQALLSAVPIPDPKRSRERKRIILPGEVPSSVKPPGGCRFHPRCQFARDLCGKEEPVLEEVGGETLVACHYWEDIQ